jgi:hypothetical protein
MTLKNQLGMQDRRKEEERQVIDYVLVNLRDCMKNLLEVYPGAKDGNAFDFIIELNLNLKCAYNSVINAKTDWRKRFNEP